MDATFSEAIKTSKDALKRSRDMITYKGGIATADKGLVALPEMIKTIPGTGVTTITNNKVDLTWSIPKGSTKYCYLAEFGGMTYSSAEDMGEYDPEGGMWDEAPDFFRAWSEDGIEANDVIIPPEILALPDFGQGINLQYYNKVDLVEQKYKKCIVTMTFDGSLDEAWIPNWGDGRSTEYFFIDYPATGIYAKGVIISSHYPTLNFLAGDNQVGIWCTDSSREVFLIKLRPKSDMTDYTLTQWREDLAANPITVKIAKLVPEISDLPVYMNPLIYLDALPDSVNEGYYGLLEAFPSDGIGIPAKFIFETIDTQGG